MSAETTTDDGTWVRGYYCVPAYPGARITMDGRPGVIAGFQGPHLLVRFDGETALVPAHPTWRVVYEQETADA